MRNLNCPRVSKYIASIFTRVCAYQIQNIRARLVVLDHVRCHGGRNTVQIDLLRPDGGVGRVVVSGHGPNGIVIVIVIVIVLVLVRARGYQSVVSHLNCNCRQLWTAVRKL